MTRSPTSQYIPERTCVACRKKRPQSELVRITKGALGWELRSGVRVGRGAYVCADNPACWQEKKLRRAFGGQAPSIAAQLAAQAGQQIVTPAIPRPVPSPVIPNPAQSKTIQSKPVDQPMMT